MTAIVTPKEYFNAVYAYYIADTKTLDYPEIPQFPNLCLFEEEECFICSEIVQEFNCNITITEI